jgi:hypothetical protein
MRTIDRRPRPVAGKFDVPTALLAVALKVARLPCPLREYHKSKNSAYYMPNPTFFGKLQKANIRLESWIFGKPGISRFRI